MSEPLLVRITAIDDYSPDMWSNQFVGRSFPLVKIHDAMIPKQYEMNVTELKEQGLVTFDRMYVPAHCAELLPVRPPDTKEGES